MIITRFDRQIHKAAVETLVGSAYGELRRLNCSVFQGVVEISGTVSSFYLKQLAQAAVMHLEQVGEVRNLVKVGNELGSAAGDVADAKLGAALGSEF